MSLKVISLLCAIFFLLFFIFQISMGIYNFITYEWYGLVNVLTTFPYWLSQLVLSVFFFSFSNNLK